MSHLMMSPQEHDSGVSNPISASPFMGLRIVSVKVLNRQFYLKCRIAGKSAVYPAFLRMEDCMKLNAIHHVAIIVSDYQKSREFYVDKLGFTVIRENYRPDKDDWKLDLQIGEGDAMVELEIFGAKNPPKRVTRPEAAGLRHLAFRVDSVEQVKAELEAMDILCEPVRMDEFSNRKFTFFQDPDGLPLELHE